MNAERIILSCVNDESPNLTVVFFYKFLWKTKFYQEQDSQQSLYFIWSLGEFYNFY